MNKNIAKPLIIQFTPPEVKPEMKRSPKSIFVPVNTPWTQFRDNVLPMVANNAYDSVLVHVDSKVNRDIKGVVGNMSIKMNALSGAGTKTGKPVLSYESPDKPFYLANPTAKDMKDAGMYAPSDETIMKKYESYQSDDAWQEHQSQIWNRMKDMMPLSKKADQYNRNHAAQLKDPKRGLEDKDLDKFWSFKSRQGLAPTIMGDDMIGMPSVEGREYEGFTMSINQPDGSVATKPLTVRSLMTTGASGIAIPMANANGHVNKHQIASDLTAYGTVLHFRAEDGKTVAKGELYDKKTREYAFNFENGDPTHLKVTDVSPDDTITMQDIHGIFNVKPKKELVDVLKSRGYAVPDIITSVKAEQNGKYVWQSPGTMTGSENVLKTVSPSNPGFIMAREPKNGSNEYVALVAEGALKGHIVAKYVDVTDKNGVCFGDKIAGDKGIIVTQVPGVAEAYVKNALTIYDKYNIVGTYIAMDADGRENRNVARGIHSAYAYINKTNPASVLSWDPAQKGMDDALLAVAQGKITIDQMGITHGTPDKLFPMENTKKMTPYTLDGKQTNTPSWVQEYGEDKAAREIRMAEIQKETADREEQKKSKAGQWVDTPQDIRNLQNATITKAAEIADAMSGKIPDVKPDSKIVHTVDVDEVVAEQIEKEELAHTQKETKTADSAQQADTKAADSVQQADDKVFQLARNWDVKNPAMLPIDIPTGYKTSCCYQQPVVNMKNNVINLNEYMSYHEEGQWGIVNITSDHLMTPQEKGEIQDSLKNDGVTIIGNMRLTMQSFTRDNSIEEIKDLGEQLA